MGGLEDGRRRPRPFPRWQVVRDGTGTWVLRDEDGHDPLKHADPVERLANLYLASNAGEYREMVRELATYFGARLEDGTGYGYDRKLIMRAHSVVGDAITPVSEFKEAAETKRSGQSEIDWEAA